MGIHNRTLLYDHHTFYGSKKLQDSALEQLKGDHAGLNGDHEKNKANVVGLEQAIVDVSRLLPAIIAGQDISDDHLIIRRPDVSVADPSMLS